MPIKSLLTYEHISDTMQIFTVIIIIFVQRCISLYMPQKGLNFENKHFIIYF